MIRKALLLSLVAAGLAFHRPALAVESGRPAPDFTLSDIKGETHTLSQHQGKFVVLEWINHDCPFVKKHYGSGNMQELQGRMTSEGVVWYSIASSAPGKQGHYSAEEWRDLSEKKKSAATAVLLDPEGETGKAYEAKTTPHMYLIAPDGTLVYQGAIDSISSADPNDISKAVNYVSKAYEEAKAGQPVEEPATRAYGCSVKY